MYSYKVFSRNGVLIAEGNAYQCAEALGIGVKSFRNVFSRKHYGKYRIEGTPEKEEKQITKTDVKAMKAWDEFCEPIRKEFGIKVKRFLYDAKGNAIERKDVEDED